MSKVITKSLIKTKIKAVVCVPIGLTAKERKAYEKVCYYSGIQDVIIVPSIMCGGIGYNLPVDMPNGLCLVNIGGGSTDIAVVSAGSIITGINISVGGQLLDSLVEESILNAHNILIGAGTAEEVKQEIGALFPNVAELYTPKRPRESRPSGITASAPASPISPIPLAIGKTVGWLTIPPFA